MAQRGKTRMVGGATVRNFRGGRLIGGAADVLRALNTENFVTEGAKAVKFIAAAEIDSNSYKPGVGLGAGYDEQDLIASGYVATNYDVNNAAYAVARTAALAASPEGNRSDYARGLVTQPAIVATKAHQSKAIVSYVLWRAILMHDGYTRASGQRMAGTPWLERAVAEVNWDFLLRDLVGVPLERFHVPDEAVMAAALGGMSAQQRAEQRALAQARGEARRARGERRDLAMSGVSLGERKRLRYGDGGRFVETLKEMHDRINNELDDYQRPEGRRN